MRTLYFDCFAGASGNMILGGLIALGVDVDELTEKLRGLNIAEFSLDVETVDRSGISSTHVKVNVPHEHVHRHLWDIEKIISESALSDNVKKRSIAIFTRLARAEAKIHGTEIQKVHFHEVGAMDAIIDVTGACIAFEMLGIERFICSKIHVGSGFVNMAHGKYPVPPPAVAELLSGIPVYSTEIEGELITPTGAAIIALLCDSYGAFKDLKIEKTAYGAGTRIYQDFPNVLRLIIGETQSSDTVPESSTISDKLLLIETNIDDLSPQVLGFVMERSLELGALDCWFTPVQMKKNRPATLLSILCTPEKKEVISYLIFCETTTLGFRVAEVARESLEREVVTFETKFGAVDVKVGKYKDNVVNIMPEYEQVKRLALENEVSFRVVRDEVLAAFNQNAFAAVVK